MHGLHFNVRKIPFAKGVIRKAKAGLDFIDQRRLVGIKSPVLDKALKQLSTKSRRAWHLFKPRGQNLHGEKSVKVHYTLDYIKAERKKIGKKE